MDNAGMQFCFIGDSFVAGIGDETALGWTGRLAAHASAAGNPMTAYNLGIRRNTSADILARCRGEVDARRSADRQTLIVLSMGVNDTTLVDGCARVEVEESCANLGQLLDLFAGDPIMVVGPPAVADDAQNVRIRELTERYHSLCRGRGIPFVPVFHALELDPVWRRQVLEGDGAHPRSEGYAALSELVVPVWDRWLGVKVWPPRTWPRPNQRPLRSAGHQAEASSPPRSSPSSTARPRDVNQAHMFLQSRASSSAPCRFPARSTSCGRSMTTRRSPAANTL